MTTLCQTLSQMTQHNDAVGTQVACSDGFNKLSLSFLKLAPFDVPLGRRWLELSEVALACLDRSVASRQLRDFMVQLVVEYGTAERAEADRRDAEEVVGPLVGRREARGEQQQGAGQEEQQQEEVQQEVGPSQQQAQQAGVPSPQQAKAQEQQVQQQQQQAGSSQQQAQQQQAEPVQAPAPRSVSDTLQQLAAQERRQMRTDEQLCAAHVMVLSLMSPGEQDTALRIARDLYKGAQHLRILWPVPRQNGSQRCGARCQCSELMALGHEAVLDLWRLVVEGTALWGRLRGLPLKKRWHALVRAARDGGPEVQVLLEYEGVLGGYMEVGADLREQLAAPSAAGCMVPAYAGSLCAGSLCAVR